MNGRTFAYLDFAALASVGAVLLDPRPAFVFRGDGSGILWANAAGVAFHGAASMGALLARRFSVANPTVRSLARLAKSLSPDRSRLEILRFNFGVRQVALPSACRGLVLRDGARALLAVGATAAPRESLSTRSERLADAIGGDDCLVAVLDRDAGVLGASGGFGKLAHASDEIDRLVAVAAVGDTAVSRASLAVDGTERQVGVARVRVGEELVFLLIAGPAEKPQMLVVPAPTPAVLESQAPADTEETGTSSAAIAAERPARPSPMKESAAARFLWQTDAHDALVFVSPDLGEAVGAGNAPGVGTPWREVAERFGVDGDGQIANAFSAISGFADITLYWPLDDTPECVAIDLTGLPIFSRDGVFEGYRGFGAIRPNDRRPRTRPASISEPVRPPRAAPPEAGALPAEGPAQQTDVPPSNVVPLGNAPARILPKRLSGHEQDAFRRIAEALAGDRSQALDPVPPPAPPDPPVVAAPFDQALLDRLPVGIAIYRDNQTLFANRPLLDWLGYASVEAFTARGGADAVFPEGEDPSTTPGNGALKAVRSDGTTLDVEAKLHAVTWEGATALMLSLAEAAAQPQAQPEVDAEAAEIDDERVRELEAILDTATDGVIVIDGEGVVDGMNRTAEALFGVSTDAVRGRPFTDLLADESRKAGRDYLEGLASNGVASVLNDGREVIGRVPRGGLIPLFMTMGRVAGSEKYCAVLRDITHWKNVEEELVAARKAAETANAQKSEFLAKISHEIRTPLNAIIGFSEVMMAERFGSIGNDRYRSYLHDIHLSGEHLMSLVNDLLDLSKVEAGKLDLDFASVAANEVIQECVALMQPQANRDRIIIRTSLADGLPNIVADTRSLRQILLNLISNAVKFTRAGGQVIVATAMEDDGAVVVRIRDTGIGMSEKDIDTAMKPFRQVATSGGVGQGTGLGLPLTKALVEANRAGFAIDSVPDQGTLVRVTFPTSRVLAG